MLYRVTVIVEQVEGSGVDETVIATTNVTLEHTESTEVITAAKYALDGAMI